MLSIGEREFTLISYPKEILPWATTDYYIPELELVLVIAFAFVNCIHFITLISSYTALYPLGDILYLFIFKLNLSHS